MLRYRTRDITRITTAPCACGRTHLRLLRVAGRSDATAPIVRGVNVYPSQVEAVLVGRPDLAPHYQLIVERQGAAWTGWASRSRSSPACPPNDSRRSHTRLRTTSSR